MPLVDIKGNVMKFICPKCGSALKINENKAAKCENGHSYDRSREGYYNLLLGADGGVHGDNKEMVTARRRFLNTNSYLPLAELVSSLVFEYTQNGGSVLDIGCGEGYYTEKIRNKFRENKKELSLSGFDISKEAVRRAAKAVSDASFAVASAYKIPVSDGSFDTAVNMFSPLAEDETRRIIHTGGHFIMAIPDKRHLFGLKSAVYDNPYENEVADAALHGFKLLKTERISYEITLTDKEDINALFMMTPYAYRTKKEDREKLSVLDKMTTEVDFTVFVYERE